MTWRARGVCGVAGVLVLVGVQCVAQAEALPGTLELSGGAHLMVLPGDRCEEDSDVIGCSGAASFAGFDLAFHGQLAPWFALGLRAAGSGEFGAVDGSASSDGSSSDDDVWLWRISGEARFDPQIWPRGLWLAAELGAVIAVRSVEFQMNGQKVGDASKSQTRFLAGGAVGWDFPIGQWLVGVELRCLLMLLEELPPPEGTTGTIVLSQAPYISVGPRFGYRW